MSKAYVLTSDVHLRTTESDLYHDWVETVSRALSKCKGASRTLLILGDLWDLYIEGNDYFVNAHASFFRQLEQWQAEGISVQWFEGNHDLYRPRADHFFETDANCFYVCHGDELNPNDTAYLRLKAALHTWGVKFLAHHLPGRLIKRIGEKMSTESKEQWVKEKPWTWNHYEKEIAKRIPALKQRGAKIFVFGHCHWKNDVVIDGVRIVNLGYFPKDRTVFVIDGAEAYWV